MSYWLAPDAQNYEVNVRLAKDRRQLATDLSNLYLTTNKRGPDGELRMVPLRQVAEIVETYEPADHQPRGAAAARGDLRQRAGAARRRRRQRRQQDHQATPRCRPGYRFSVRGQQEQMQDSFKAAMAALGLAVIFIYLILASQFASFLQPVAIMASLPFSLIGVFLALMFTGTTLNIFSMIGFIMLMGLVTKNAILLVDFANRARRGGASAARRDAAGGPGAAAADPHDHRGDDRRHAAAGASASGEGGETAGADGARDHRRRDHLDAADAGRRAGALHVPRRLDRAPSRAKARDREAAARRTAAATTPLRWPI